MLEAALRDARYIVANPHDYDDGLVAAALRLVTSVDALADALEAELDDD